MKFNLVTIEGKIRYIDKENFKNAHIKPDARRNIDRIVGDQLVLGVA